MNLKLAAGGANVVLAETLTLGDKLPSEEFEDSHGNRVHRVTLERGTNYIKHDAIVAASSKPDNFGLVPGQPNAVADLPLQVLRYTLPSRYCDSDKLTNFAWEKFGHVEHGWPRVHAISRWIHENIEYRYLSGRSDLSAWDVLQCGYGVCRDFAISLSHSIGPLMCQLVM